MKLLQKILTIPHDWITWLRWISESKIKAHTHNIGAFGLEGVRAACVQVCVVVALQEANVVEALSLQRRR